MYAFYSEKQRPYTGIVIWNSKDGKEIECTEVSKTMEHESQFDDVKFLGEVETYVRRKETMHFQLT